MENTLKAFSHALCRKMLLYGGALALIMMLFTGAPCMAESWYIKPSAEIPLRRGQGTDYKIDAILPSGAEVSILEEEGSWVRVKSVDGREGWMLRRYLSQEKPLDELVDSLRKENALLKEGQASATGKNEAMDLRNTQLQQEVESCVADLARIREDYQALQKDTSDVIGIKNDLAASEELVRSLQQELNVALEENEQLTGNQNIKWFLAGGGTLIFGCIVGMMISRSRKRKPSLY